MAGEDRVALLLDDLLAASVAAISAPPSRQFVAHGDRAAHDCDSLFVRVEQIRVREGTQDGTYTMQLLADMEVVLLRCFPKPEGKRIPSPAVIEAASRDLAVDGWSLVRNVSRAALDGTLFVSVPTLTCDQVEFGNMTPIGPEGGIGGWQLPLTVAL